MIADDARQETKGLDRENIFSENILVVYEKLQHASSYIEMLLIADCFVKKIISEKRKDNHPLDSISKLMIQSNYGAIKKYYILCTEAKDMDKSVLTSDVHCEKIYELASSHSPFFDARKVSGYSCSD